MLKIAIIAFFLATSINSNAANTPCSGKKGGISHCQGALFICNDGSVSQSKKTCSGYEKLKQSKK